MCYLNKVKHCKPSAMLYLNYLEKNTKLYLNYIKQIIINVLCFSTCVKQNANNAMYLLNRNT